MASEGYPDHYQAGKVINGLDQHDNAGNFFIFHAATKRDEKGQVLSTGGRVLGVTGLGATLNDAVKQAYKGIDAITFPDSHYRTDIAYLGLNVEDKHFASRS